MANWAFWADGLMGLKTGGPSADAGVQPAGGRLRAGQPVAAPPAPSVQAAAQPHAQPRQQQQRPGNHEQSLFKRLRVPGPCRMA